jgi:hypothetical protein
MTAKHNVPALRVAGSNCGVAFSNARTAQFCLWGRGYRSASDSLLGEAHYTDGKELGIGLHRFSSRCSGLSLGRRVLRSNASPELST